MIKTALAHRFYTINLLLAMLGLGLCLMLLYALASMRGQHVADVRWQRPSSFFTDASGTRAIYLILRRLLPAVEQWRRPPSLLPSPASLEAPTTLIVFGPHQSLSTLWAQTLDDWMAQGGQVILVTHRDWRMTSAAQQPDPRPLPRQTAASQAHAYLLRHGLRVVEDSDSVDLAQNAAPLALGPYHVVWGEDSPLYAALVTAGEKILVGSKRIGQGRLVVVPDAWAFSNHRLRDSHNAVWLVTLCATWGNGRVLIDEFHHGFGSQRGLLVLLGQFLLTPWGWIGLQCLLAGGLYVCGPLRRFGRISDVPPVPRRSPLDMVAARAGFFAAAHAKRLAVELIHQHLQARLGTHIGHTLRLDMTTMRERLAAKAPHLTRDFDHYMSLVQHGLRGAYLSNRAFLHLAQLAARMSREFKTP